MGIVTAIEHAVRKPVFGRRMCGRRVLHDMGTKGRHLTDFRHDGSLSRLCRDLDIPLKEERRSYAHRPQLTV